MTAAIAPVTFAPRNPPVCEHSALLNLLIVNDDSVVREACREAATALGYRACTSQSADQALWFIDSETIDVVLLDLNLPSAGRLDILREIKRRRPGVEVVVVSGNATVQSAVQAMKAGAYDYITKPFGLQELKLLLERVGAHLQVKSENRRLGERIKSSQGVGDMIGRAPEMDRLYRMIGKAAQSAHPVLILGESGTGKEMVARAIHCSGPFRDKPFVPVDCGSLVPTLIESELFGYVKGAFTGATQCKPGLLAIAENGTVFLDEVGELSIDLQAKLLRALQEKEIRPVGSTKQVPINVRILAATNRDLEQALAQGSFRRDLYFRLNVLSLRIPPLRERRQDIPVLATSFLVCHKIPKQSPARQSAGERNARYPPWFGARLAHAPRRNH
jgi:DNA-binding NtrC family response regulator